MDQGLKNQTRDPHQVEEKVGSNPHHVSLESNFLNNTPKAQEIKAGINKWNGFKLKSFFSKKETIGNVKREPIEWEKIFTTCTSDKALIPRMHKKCKKKITPEIQITQSINGLRNWADTSQNKIYK